MNSEEPPKTVRPLFEMGSEIPSNPEVDQEIQDRKGESERVVKRLTTISADSRKTVELDQTTQGRLSRMDALQVQEMALEQAYLLWQIAPNTLVTE